MNKSSYMLATLLAVGVGWGVLWAATQGVELAFLPAQTGHSSPSDQTAQVGAAQGPSSAVLSVTVAPAPKDPNALTILMGGDIMFDRGVRMLGQKYGYDSLFASATPLFKTADVVVANLEGPITSTSSKTLLSDGSYGGELRFTFATTTASVLERAGITLVSLANNHTDNFGKNGFDQTTHWLDAAGVSWFGDPWNNGTDEKVICQNGICAAFVGYHAFQPGFDRIVADVKRLSAEGDFVIVMPHWGQEYSATSTADQRAKARALVAAGANAVIGSHPHVIEEHEWIGAVPVYYSLGNLLFDQYFSKATMKGEIVELHLVKSANGIALGRLQTYAVSTASKKGIAVNMEPTDDSR